jgi:hypothetical protein
MKTKEFRMGGKDYWSIGKYMAAVGLSRYLVDQAILSGRLKTIRLGSRKFIDVTELKAEIENPQTI